MLDVLFGQVLSCSFIGSYVIIAVMVARLLLKNSPKIYSYALWSVVFFRLLVPFTLESPLGILPETQSILPMNQESNTISQEKTENQVSTSESPEVTISSSGFQDSVQNSTSVWSILWCMGMSVLVIPSLYSVVKLHKQLRISFHLEKNIYLVDSIDTPFVWGLLKPKIYLPSTLNEEEKKCVIPHEEYHLKRFDHLTRLLAFFTLLLHWFNPLVWFAFVLSGRDMELSVDEKVIKNIDDYIYFYNEFAFKQKRN
ncbi:MAG: M56 family metallopeptidase [Eubacteriales bacterium]